MAFREWENRNGARGTWRIRLTATTLRTQRERNVLKGSTATTQSTPRECNFVKNGNGNYACGKSLRSLCLGGQKTSAGQTPSTSTATAQMLTTSQFSGATTKVTGRSEGENTSRATMM